jgi:hypothetical protein
VLMVPRLSEFSYGYALTEQLARQLGPLAAAPRFPSLIEEGRLGYDLELTMPLKASMFLQFKLSERMVRRNVTELRPPTPLPITLPFFRMHIWPSSKSNQHALLYALAARGEWVWYVAPEFDTVDELNAAYVNRKVVQQSRFFDPAVIGVLPDDEKHHLAFEGGNPRFWLCSEPRELPATTPPVERLSQPVMTLRPPRSLREELDRLVGVMTAEMEGAAVQRAKSDSLGSLDEVRPDLMAPYLARMYFNCVLILVGDDVAASTAPG